MRIGELAAVAGVTSRTVRHYHRVGLLPEPIRRSNGYRQYDLRAAVELVRIRRLTELGLSLDEVADVLADDEGRELHEVLAALDADLERQQESIRLRRERLAGLLEQARDGTLPAEGPVSAELAELFGAMARTSSERPGPEPAMAAKERELFALLEGSSTDASGGWLAGLVGSLGSDPEALHRAYDLYTRMDELAGAGTDDPRVAEVAGAVVELMPQDVIDSMAGVEEFDVDEGDGFVGAYFADLAPAQAEAVRQAIRLVQERVR
ncbi:DNA-binding transcriptional MerR regulator [Haloactinopolyspora alba]|uniref:DNA-binding transcriptional MerR regulator n=1 Tax=Haloactinopolyspora alba TaxID=648780 RepID=A0A2P8D710_9ACTN|nr:MerR family transcriptional regulator [Haloactinopolyspora alba]PSK93004.1 DNA-binding transcriptional MerR regulator [Haloactinopolyspora alba]